KKKEEENKKMEEKKKIEEEKKKEEERKRKEEERKKKEEEKKKEIQQNIPQEVPNNNPSQEQPKEEINPKIEDKRQSKKGNFMVKRSKRISEEIVEETENKTPIVKLQSEEDLFAADLKAENNQIEEKPKSFMEKLADRMKGIPLLNKLSTEDSDKRNDLNNPFRPGRMTVAFNAKYIQNQGKIPGINKEFSYTQEISNSPGKNKGRTCISPSKTLNQTRKYSSYGGNSPKRFNCNKKEASEIISPLRLKGYSEEEDSFCDGFFIASFSKKNGKVMENSEGFRASCGHEKCSSLPAMEPEVIFQYPGEEKSSLSLNKLAASICFPNGIKVCYEESDNIKIVPNYSSSLVNSYGQRYYIFTHHFYYKILNQTFMANYSMHPIKYDTTKLVNFSKILTNSKIEKSIHKKLDLYSQLNFRDIVYVPYCVCLISKYPYFKQMEKCLESLQILLSHHTADNIKFSDCLKFIIHNICLPKSKTSTKFFLPFVQDIIEISSPLYKDLPIVTLGSQIIFNLFSVDQIMLIFRIILFEQKIVFLDDNYERLSLVQHIFLSLLYPFQ
ncbi:MAG: hypothetical protein MJ252_18630, partial [archaeon]|nr:hypothetical protein [archaeon]